jgi:hypothetical protein
MLVSKLAVAETNDATSATSTRFPVGAIPGQHPVHLDRMGEAHNHFVDQLAGPDGARQRRHLYIRAVQAIGAIGLDLSRLE